MSRSIFKIGLMDQLYINFPFMDKSGSPDLSNILEEHLTESRASPTPPDLTLM
ncbi:unnamed protein product [Moneuplotes crassus]|uniref:Uncharacterized protein n=1 Tax=Euplotes crassus TaxID=5936 RepID=A0AAD1Y8N3_EUPCR|nr:unnamed protein product [Moneuplotes crassus]